MVLTEGQQSDCKSLRKVTGRTANFSELAQDCVCFANGSGGRLLIGIEDGQSAPPTGQRIDPTLLDHIRKRVGELTVNIQVLLETCRAETGDEYITLTIPRSVGVASTSDGRYFVRVGDTCKPVVGDDILRLADERPATPWESMISLQVTHGNLDKKKQSKFTTAIRASDRVKSSVKEKGDQELLDHYGLALGDVLTNLGVLLLGTMSGMITACHPPRWLMQSGEKCLTFAKVMSSLRVYFVQTLAPQQNPWVKSSSPNQQPQDQTPYGEGQTGVNCLVLEK